jgi:hypothetical protein
MVEKLVVKMAATMETMKVVYLVVYLVRMKVECLVLQKADE